MKVKLSIIVLLLLSITGIAVAQVGDMPPEEIERIAHSIVMIGIVEGGQEVGVGSGTIVSNTGLIYTNRHVVEGSEDLYIYLLEDMNDQPVFRYRARPVAVFSEMDFAIIQIDRNATGGVVIPTSLNLPFLTPTPTEIARGTRIYVFGYPTIGEGFMVLTDGLISSAQNGTIGEERMVTWYQTNAEIAPGNSGGLAVTADGELVGIPTSVLSEDRTSARLGGILPFRAVLALAESGGATDVTTTATGPQGDTFSEILSIDHNIDMNGTNGMVVHSRIQVTGFKDQTIAAAVYFYDTGGNLVPVGAAANEENTDGNGWLRSRVELTPGFDSTIWDDVSFFVPYAAFPDGLSGEVTFSAEADVFDGTNWIAPSEKMDFVITYSGSTSPGNTTLSGTATTTILDIEHNVEQVGQNGMMIHVQAQITGFKDLPVVAGVFFYDMEGRLIEAASNAAEEFVAPNELLRVRTDLTPGFDDTIYDDLQLWIPYAAFPDGVGEVTYTAEADIFDGSTWIAPSNQVEFIITYGDASSTATTTQQTTQGGGITASCADFTITNGVEIIVRQMRPSFTYTATVIGLNGFDPVLIVRDTVNTNNAICNDDADDAAKYTVNLPSSGSVAASPRSSQLFFNHSNANMTDISLIVGDFSGSGGEFILVLEGMAVTSADGVGDPFTVDVNSSVTGSSVPLSVYMIGAETQLDPLVHLTDNSLNIWLDTEGIAINCDDGGTNTCWGESADLSASQIMRGSNGVLRPDNRDAMLALPILELDPQPMTFVMSSYNRETTGLYAIAFHMGLS